MQQGKSLGRAELVPQTSGDVLSHNPLAPNSCSLGNGLAGKYRAASPQRRTSCPGPHSQISWHPGGSSPTPPLLSGELCPKQALVQVPKESSSHFAAGMPTTAWMHNQRPCWWDLSLSSVRETDLQTADEQGQMSDDDFAGCLGLQLLRQLDAKVFCT